MRPGELKEKQAAEKKEAAAKLRKLLDDTLNHPNHHWYLNRMDPAEKARREQERMEFQKRYAK